VKKWITFDLDGTLMQNPFGKWVFPEIARILKAEVTAPDYDPVKRLIQEHERRMMADLTVEAYDWDDMAQAEIEAQGLSIEINVEQMVLSHCQIPRIHLLDDTIAEALPKLSERDYSLAVVTNGFYKYQFPVLDTLGIAGCFEEIVTPEMRGCAKPKPEILHGLLERGRIVAHVGDRLDHDVFMANAAGIPSVFVHRSLPERLAALTPRERALDEGLREILERKLAEEKVERTGAEGELDAYWPTYVIAAIGELNDIAFE